MAASSSPVRLTAPEQANLAQSTGLSSMPARPAAAEYLRAGQLQGVGIDNESDQAT